METYRCSGCGKIIETIPQCCAHNMVYNEDKNQFECYMGDNCGYLSLSELKCEECCTKLN
ncbi:MAG: hypothetical protein HWN79_11510 [Candidatus Lokiarchaeota archaeon]|nr:hypothetical protein [Candidatus Lokiarchaeota archaeon]